MTRNGYLAIGGFLAVAVLGILLRPALPVDETRYLDVAWEMHLTGNWLVPTKNFAIYSDKPPLLFWCMNLLWSFFGVSEFWARLVGPLWAALAIWLTGRLAARLWPDDSGVADRARLALVAQMIFVLAGGLTMFDAMLTVPVLLGLLALTEVERDEGFTPWCVLGAAIALGVLAKGPVILLHLLPAAILLPLWSRQVAWRRVGAGVPMALAMAVLLIAIWLVPAALLGGSAYRQAIFWTQSAGRMTESFAHARPWWFFIALSPLLLFPWLWIPAMWKAAANAPWRDDRGLRLCIIWLGAAAIAFSLISGKQIHYLVPELPAVALIVARIGRDAMSRRGWALFPVLVLAIAALGVGAGLLPSPNGVGSLLPQAGYLALGLGLVALVWASASIRGFNGMAFLSLGMVLLGNATIGLTDLRREYDSAPMAAKIAPFSYDGIAYVGKTYHAQFNFAGRLQLPVDLPASDTELLAWIAQHPAGIIVAPRGRHTPDWPTYDTLSWRGSTYGLWLVADAPKPEPSS